MEATNNMSALIERNRERQQQISESKKPQLLSRSTLTRLNNLREQYRTLDSFLVACNPSEQEKYVGDPLEVLNSELPTMTELCLAYGDDASVAWLIPEILSVSEFCGCKDKFTGEQLEATARLIAKGHHNLTVSELHLFFGWLKLGKYGRFYGSLDPMVITEALCEFIKWRNRSLADIEWNKQANKTWDSYDHWKAEEEKRKAWAKQLCKPKGKGIGFTPRSEKTKVNAVGDIMRDMAK